MALLGTLDPRQQQAEQQRTRSAQALQAEAELAKLLQGHGQNEKGQQFTSPWQVAGQWAQTLAGRSKANDVAQGYAALNEPRAPGGGAADASPMPSAASAPAGQPSAAPAASSAPSQGTSRQPPFSPELNQAILEGSKAAGVNPQWAARVARIESSGNPHAQSGSYLGLMQISPDEMKRVSNGQGNVWDAKDSTMAAGLIAKENAQRFRTFTGREPNGFDLYMMHQQGPAGYFQHIGNPDAPAWENMAATGEGKQKGQRWAQAAITGNLGKPGDTSRQFLQRWSDRWQRYEGGDHSAFEDADHKANTPPTSPLVERGQQFVPDEMLRNPQPTYSMERLQALARSGQLSPDQIQKFNAEIQTANQPKSVDFAGGKVTRDPRTGGQIYMPKIENRPIKLPGGLETTQTYWIDSQGRQHSAAQGYEPDGSSAMYRPDPDRPGKYLRVDAGQGGATGLGAAIRSGNIDEMAAAGARHAAGLKEQETTATELAKGRAVPVAEAIKAGPAAQRSLAALNTLDVIGNMQGAENMTTGPFAQMALHVKQALGDLGFPMEGVTPAEGINKMNAYLGMAAARELTNRPTQFDFKTFLQNNPGIEMSPAGRRMLTDILQQTARQDIELAKIASRVDNPREWADIQDRYYRDHPIVVHYQGHEIRSADSLGQQPSGGTSGAAPGAPAAPGPQSAAPSPTKGWFEALQGGDIPTLYNPKRNLLPGRTGKEPQMRGLDLPVFGEGMANAPGTTLTGAATLPPAMGGAGLVGAGLRGAGHGAVFGAGFKPAELGIEQLIKLLTGGH